MVSYAITRREEERKRVKPAEVLRRNVENEACGYRVDNRVDNFAARGGLTISVRRRALKLDDDDAATTKRRRDDDGGRNHDEARR